jgi:hypothetical protein
MAMIRNTHEKEEKNGRSFKIYSWFRLRRNE